MCILARVVVRVGLACTLASSILTRIIRRRLKKRNVHIFGLLIYRPRNSALKSKV